MVAVVNKNPTSNAKGAEKVRSKAGSSVFYECITVLVAVTILCSNVPWGKTSKGVSIYVNQHAEHTCENIVSRFDIDGNAKVNICAVFDITNILPIVLFKSIGSK